MTSNEVTTWVLLADATLAKVYERKAHSKTFKLHHELEHPEGRSKVHDLVTDHSGKYGAGSATGMFVQDHNPKDNENTQFVLQIVQALEHARATNQFDQLIIIALPHFYGLLEQHLSEQLHKKVVRHITKDYLHLPEKELLEKVFSAEEI